eukprot:3935245-Rhodomonas_salina.1
MESSREGGRERDGVVQGGRKREGWSCRGMEGCRRSGGGGGRGMQSLREGEREREKHGVVAGGKE